MNLFAWVLAIIALTKLLLTVSDEKVELKKLVSGLPVHADLADPITKSLIVIDGLLEAICALILISTI